MAHENAQRQAAALMAHENAQRQAAYEDRLGRSDDELMVENAALRAQVNSQYVKQAIWKRRDRIRSPASRSPSASASASVLPENSVQRLQYELEDEKIRVASAEEAIADLESRLRLAEEENNEIKKQCRDVTLGVRCTLLPPLLSHG